MEKITPALSDLPEATQGNAQWPPLGKAPATERGTSQLFRSGM